MQGRQKKGLLFMKDFKDKKGFLKSSKICLKLLLECNQLVVN